MSMEVSQIRKKVLEPPLTKTNKQTNSICQICEFKINNFYWGTLHSIVERSKEILPKTSMEVSQRRKKTLEPPLKQTNI